MENCHAVSINTLHCLFFHYPFSIILPLFAFEGLDLPIRFPVGLALLLRLGFMPEWLLAFIIFT